MTEHGATRRHGFRVQGLGFGVWGLGFRVQGIGQFMYGFEFDGVGRAFVGVRASLKLRKPTFGRVLM